MAETLDSLQKALGVSFRDSTLLQQALCHSSYCNENPGAAPVSNERLEFVGDAVLGLIIAEKLYTDYPSLTEGEMTKLRSVLVRRETLARVARTMNLGDYLYMGRGEEAGGGGNKPLNLAGATEALIAAIYFDQGIEAARKFVLMWFGSELINTIKLGVEVNYKSELQEATQLRQQLTPSYRLIDAAGPDHDRTFTVEVIVGEEVLGKGTGKSKKEAETEAARQALENIR